MKAIICDIDGTLADCTHRVHHIQGQGKKDWNSFFGAMGDDPCHENVRFLLRSILGTKIVFCSGRPADYRDVTLYWLDRHGFRIGDGFTTGLYMRASGDFRDDSIVKRELLTQIRADGYEPWLVLDDRDRVVKMWREEGLTCLQCAPGDF